jgi:hypothetical protein
MHRDVPEVTDHAHAARNGSQKRRGSSLKIIVIIDIIVIIVMAIIQLISIIGNIEHWIQYFQ